MVVEPVVDRLERAFHVAEVHHPPGLRADFAAQVQLHPERMPVQTRALVALGHVGKAMRGFEGEGFEDVHGGAT